MSLAETLSVTEPRRRKDGLCALETCRKPIKPPARYRRDIDRRVYEREAFCSAACARAYFGVVISSGPLNAIERKRT